MSLPLLCLLVALPQQDATTPRPAQHRALDRRHESTSGELETGGWLGLRSLIEDRGIEVHAFATTDASIALAGGRENRSDALRTLIDVTMEAETEPLFGLPGGQIFFDFQWQGGQDSSTEIGDLQVYSNIDAPDFSRVAEVWWQQEFWDSAFTLQLGRIDVNGSYALVDNGVRFIHSSMGFSPTIVGLPTYPEATFGASGRVALCDNLAVSVGAFNADPSGSFMIGQSDVTWTGGRLGLGAWRHTGRFDRFDGGMESGASGEYLTLDQSLASQVVSNEDRLGAFFQLAGTDTQVSPFTGHLGLGVLWEANEREGSNALGLGFSRARLSDAPGANFDTRSETAWELFYSFALTDWLNLKPDLQYVQNPGGDASIEDAWIFTLRTTLGF